MFQMLLVHLLPVEYAVRFLDYKHRFLTAMHESLFAQRLILILSYTMSIIDCIDCTHILTSSLMIHIKIILLKVFPTVPLVLSADY